MPSFKIDRMSEDIHRELTDIFRSVKDPRVSRLLSIVRVELAGDGSHCKVYVSSLSGWDDTVESVKGLRSAAGFIRRELGHNIDLRIVPELQFELDTNIEYAAHINQLLKEDEARHGNQE